MLFIIFLIFFLVHRKENTPNTKAFKILTIIFGSLTGAGLLLCSIIFFLDNSDTTEQHLSKIVFDGKEIPLSQTVSSTNHYFKLPDDFTRADIDKMLSKCHKVNRGEDYLINVAFVKDEIVEIRTYTFHIEGDIVQDYVHDYLNQYKFVKEDDGWYVKTWDTDNAEFNLH